MDNLADLLKQKKNTSALWRSVDAHLIVEKANKILIELFGQIIASQANAVYCKNEVLTIACLNSIWAQEIRLNESKILDRINTELPSAGLKKIRYLA
ncbi:MAG: hypothetical protein COU31_00795 [Candidatus Magasanikbacteria bacterium CG10_big_fil_rev_8_21_14_0_10_40_10]|uniref:DUF721 domain-containing protein n=1 Tax=Candidatus Magasanikbacteria bacterium CG10_big_fil_rev_8_21_14_0_10_40_10 TaxID=1974648 RepID=A0A2M6W4Y8_9BACT|nr:MAG: hypothetical protein COU31_00795 [Candidatus Magasanikbacteria bacterium CG10_big_fil_rev_8_21_14_0_10_40_10]